MTTLESIERRLEKVEEALASLKRSPDAKAGKEGWLDFIRGRHANDPLFDEAMKIGREYRASLRPDAES